MVWPTGSNELSDLGVRAIEQDVEDRGCAYAATASTPPHNRDGRGAKGENGRRLVEMPCTVAQLMAPSKETSFTKHKDAPTRAGGLKEEARPRW